jgi:L-seryl-tRNA(Ser) seleniumtransferase
VEPALRALPSVERVLREPAARALVERAGRAVAVARVREALAAEREAVRTGVREAAGPGEIAERAAAAEGPSLVRVLNATGVVVHTNLGRAPLAAAAVDAVAATAGAYANLELDLATGRRGSRQAHVEALLRELTGAEAALAVNNNAAALVLVLAAHAAGREVIVSRGQLVEIGDGFRIPEILAATGARLVEVGATNRTRLTDYERAIGPETALILRAHPSNYRIVGFTEEVAVAELVALGRARGVAVVDDLGSGLLAADPVLAGEPDARGSVAAGATLACFSGDKLLGGPQAGIIVGEAAAIEACRRHPLARALRIDRLSLAALEATLRLHRDPALARSAVPVLRMAHEPLAGVRARAARLAGAVGGELVETEARIGGGALPTLALPSAACALPDPRGTLQAALRGGTPPLVARLVDGQLLLDARTLGEDEIDEAARCVRAARA